MIHSKYFYIFAIFLLTVVIIATASFCLASFGAEWREQMQRELWRAVIEKINWNEFPWEDFPWDSIPEDFPWDIVPWENLPWEEMADRIDWENFPWKNFPWEDLGENFPYESLPWDKLPDDFPYEDIPWGDLSENFPYGDLQLDKLPDEFWENLDWDKLPEDFPYEDIPWDDMSDEFWQNLDWNDLPEDFPYDKVPWTDMPPEFWETFPFESLPPAALLLLPWAFIHPELVPDGIFPDDFYPSGGEWDHEHEYISDIWITVIPATCGTAGEEQNFCTVCKQTVSRPIEPTGEHIFDSNGICAVCGTRHIILVSENKTKEYDGLPLDGTCELTFGEGSASLLPGHSVNYNAATFAVCSDISDVSNRFFFFNDEVIVDGEGNDVTSDYVIDYIYGTLTMTPYSITIKTADATRAYNGSELKDERYELVGNQLLPGHTLYVEWAEEGQTEVGWRENEIVDFRIEDEDGDDVTDYYTAVFEFGRLTVTK